MRLELLQCVLSPFLKIGTMIDTFQSSGNTALFWREFLILWISQRSIITPDLNNSTALSFIYTNVCTCFSVTLKSLKTLFINNPTCFDPLRPSSRISSFISSLSCCYSILKMFKIFIKTASLSCGSICFVCLWCALCGGASCRLQLAPPQSAHHRHTKHMLPHDNNAVFINNLNILRNE